MKIAFFVGEFPSLSETFVLDQMTALIDRGHSVCIFSERASRETVVHHAVAQYGLLNVTRYELLPKRMWQRIVGLPPIWRWRRADWQAINVFRYGINAASLRLAWAARMMPDEAEFDIMQCHFGALGLKAVQLRKIGAVRGRIVTAFHGEDIENYPKHFPPGHYARLFADGDLFLPVSNRWNATLLALGCPVERLRVHRMGVDLRNFSDCSKRPSPSPRVQILTVARLVEKKGIADAIRAVAQLSLSYEFIIVGDGPLRSTLEVLASGLPLSGTIRFTGALPRQQIAALLRTTDIFLAPSKTSGDGDIEGIPVAIMEAMASGLPVVSTRHSAIPELVQDTVSGFLSEEGDVQSLAARIMQLAHDPELRKTMGAAGRAAIARDFDVSMLTAKLVEHYEHILDASATSSSDNQPGPRV